jgi:hypothetical protein
MSSKHRRPRISDEEMALTIDLPPEIGAKLSALVGPDVEYMFLPVEAFDFLPRLPAPAPAPAPRRNRKSDRQR